MAPLLIAGALALSKMQERKAQRDAKRQAVANLFTQRTNTYGQPTYDLQALQQQQQIGDIEGPNYLGMMMDAEDKKRHDTGDKEASLGGKDYFRMFTS